MILTEGIGHLDASEICRTPSCSGLPLQLGAGCLDMLDMEKEKGQETDLFTVLPGVMD